MQDTTLYQHPTAPEVALDRERLVADLADQLGRSVAADGERVVTRGCRKLTEKVDSSNRERSGSDVGPVLRRFLTRAEYFFDGR